MRASASLGCARDRRVQRSGAAWLGVALIHVDYGPAARAAGAAGDAHADEGRCVAGRSTRRSFNAPPQCEQSMGLGAGASLSVLTGLAANPCAISTRALTCSKGTPKLGERKP